jgi:hypothetical protein
MIFRIKKNYFSKTHMFVKETSYVFCKVGTHFLNLYYIKFILKSVKTCLFILETLLEPTRHNQYNMLPEDVSISLPTTALGVWGEGGLYVAILSVGLEGGETCCNNF